MYLLQVCYNKENKPYKALNMCDEISKLIDIETNCKALYQYGCAVSKLGRNQEALKTFKKAQLLKPTDINIQTKLEETKNAIQKENDQEKNMCKKIFLTESSDNTDDKKICEPQKLVNNLINNIKKLNTSELFQQTENTAPRNKASSAAFVSGRFCQEIKDTLSYFKTSKLKHLELAMKLSPYEIEHLENEAKKFGFWVEKISQNKNILWK